MNKLFSEYWWVLALRGLIAIAFGVLTILWPGLTVLTLVFLFTFYALLGGAASVIGAIQSRRNNPDWWMPFLIGVVSIGAGVIAIAHPTLTVLILVLVIAANALIIGVLDIAAAIQLRKIVHNEKLMLFNGIASVAFGILVFLFPEAGGLAMLWLISLYAFVTGVLLIALSYRVRNWPQNSKNVVERRMTPDRRITSGYA
ncbi:MAG: HdeD family acid-resistance protein [Burkholderiaceae bacterium]